MTMAIDHPSLVQARRPIVGAQLDRASLSDHLTDAFRRSDAMSTALHLLEGEPEGRESEIQLLITHQAWGSSPMLSGLLAERQWFDHVRQMSDQVHPDQLLTVLVGDLEGCWTTAASEQLAFGLFRAPPV